MDPFPPDPVRAVIARMAVYPGWWAIAGGWAVDLHLGRHTRDHEDIEVTTLRSDLGLLHRAFDGDWEYVEPHPEGLEDAGTRLLWDGSPLELPVHQVAVAAAAGRVDVVLSESRGDTWHYRRDQRVELSLAEAVRKAPGGLPYLAPAVVLLFKAKHLRSKDIADFARLAPLLTDHEADWLASALAIAHPAHAWLPRLESGFRTPNSGF